MVVFFMAFLATFIAEMGDKTQLVTLTLSSRYSPRYVLPGALAALGVITGIAVILGEFLANLFPQHYVLIASGLFFIFIGIFLYVKKEDADEDINADPKNITFQTFLLVFFAELGDKTQLTAIALTAAYGQPLAVFLGAMTGQLINHSIAAFLGSRFLSKLPANFIKIASTTLFIIFGIMFLFASLAA